MFLLARIGQRVELGLWYGISRVAAGHRRTADRLGDRVKAAVWQRPLTNFERRRVSASPIWHAACCPDARAAMYAPDACRPVPRISAADQALPHSSGAWFVSRQRAIS